MKPTKFIKRAFAFGLGLSLVVTASSVNNFTTASAAKKPKLSKSKVSLTVGKTKTLTVSNASKKVKWSTSKKKIVKITKKSGTKNATATIKALKKGSAVITAKVGKKKLTCKVTAKNPVPNFKSVSVDQFDQSCLVLTLKKKDASLTESSFTVTTKWAKNGTYNNKVNVRKLVKVNNKTYRIYLDSYIYNGDYVQVVSGVSSASTQEKLPLYAEEDTVYSFYKKGDTVSKSYTGSYFNNVIGEIKLTVKKGTLPAGLTLDAKKSVIKGIPTETGTSTVTLQAKDELGRTATMDVVFGIYDDTSIVVESQEHEIALNDELEEKAAAHTAANATSFDSEKQYAESYTINPVGGSGNYTFTLAAADNAEVRLSTDVVADDAAKTVTKKSASSTRLCIPYSIGEGTHTYEVTATDVMDASRTCTATITVNVVPYYNLTGVVKSSNGLKVSGTSAYLIPSKANSIADAIRVDVNDNRDGVTEVGTYSAEVPADTYTVKVFGDVRYQMASTIKVSSADAIANITVPVKFYTVSANTTYSNKENKLQNKTIYLETAGFQYENDPDAYESYGYTYSVRTDDQGSFNIALPTNKFAAYILDEKDNRKYFSKKITVTSKDQIISSLQASIARYSVEGLVYNGTSVDPSTQFADTLKSTTLYFYNALGVCTSTRTDSRGAYKVYLEADSTYTVRAKFGSAERTIGSVTVASANQSGTDLRYTNEAEIATAQEYAVAALGTEAVITSTGNNDIMWRFTPAEDGRYQITVATAVDCGSDIYVYDSNLQCVDDLYQSHNDVQTQNRVTLEANKTYYVKVIPIGNSSAQAQGEVKLTITKSTVTVPTDPTIPTDPTVPTDPDVSDQIKDLPYHGDLTGTEEEPPVMKFTVEEDGYYRITCGAEEEIYDLFCMIYNSDNDSDYLSYKFVESDDNNISQVEGSVFLEAGEYTIVVAAFENEDSIEFLPGTYSLSIEAQED